MAKKAVFISLIGLMATMILQFDFNAPGAVQVVSPAAAETITPESDSCAQPSGTGVQICAQREQQIYDTTVRMAFQTWSMSDEVSGFDINETYAHATIKDGHYLVTHNHFDFSLQSDAENGSSTMVTIHKADGQVIYRVPMDELTLVIEAAETLVFDVGEEGRQMLADAGLRSANFKSWSALALQPGMEVAQLDWDGTVAHIDWVAIDSVLTNEGTPRLELDNFVRVGASGGAIFWNGYHVANNWARVSDLNADGQVLRAYSVGALNPPTVAVELHSGEMVDNPMLMTTEM